MGIHFAHFWPWLLTIIGPGNPIVGGGGHIPVRLHFTSDPMVLAKVRAFGWRMYPPWSGVRLAGKPDLGIGEIRDIGPSTVLGVEGLLDDQLQGSGEPRRLQAIDVVS